MFTPRRSGRSGGWPFSPRINDDNGSVPDVGKSKGKGVVGDEGPLLGDSVVDDWRGFKDAGLLDHSVLQRRDRESLVATISDLEKELHEYQYNMGLLLIEKKDWLSKYEEMRQGRAEAEVMLKREQTSHLIAVSDHEKREENMHKALGVEKQCVSDLEKALREMRAEVAEVKFTCEKKVVDANAIEAASDEKNLEVEVKLHSADAKLAEASRRSSEINRKMEDVEARECKLQREILFLRNERQAQEKDLSQQREHLQNWEKKLQDGQKRLVDGQRFLNERENRANESQSILKRKEEELGEAQRVIKVGKNSLKDKEDDVDTRLRALTIKEKEIESKKQNLLKKENDLCIFDEKLNAREKVELQKLLDDNHMILNAKKQEFELEIEQNRKSFDEDLKIKLVAVEKEKTVIGRKEEQVLKREHAIESKMEKLKMKEKDLDTKSKALKKWEECIKDDERKLQAEKQQLGHDTQELVASKSAHESLKSAIETEKLLISSEKESLKVTEEEREQHLLLQSKLKQEIEEYQRLKESLLRENEDLRQEREKFEKEWEELDEKRAAFEVEVRRITDERSSFEKWRHAEEERLKKEAHEVRLDVNRELETLRLKKESFESTMEFERSEAREMLKRERADIARELELRRHELEMDIQKKQEEMEKKLQERERDFDRRRESELSHIKSSSSLNESATRKLNMEQDRLLREKEQLSIYKNKLVADQLEIQKDNDTLGVLNKNLKGQREEFVKEREHFLAMAEGCKTCKNCGVPIHELELLGLKRTMRENELVENVVFSSLAHVRLAAHDGGSNTDVSPPAPGSRTLNSGGRVSWLQKCSKLFMVSPGKKAETSADGQTVKIASFGPQADMSASEGEDGHRYTPSSPIPYRPLSANSSDAQKAETKPDFLPDSPAYRNLKRLSSEAARTLTVMDDEGVIPSVREQNEIDSQESQQRRRQPSRKARKSKTMRRTNSVVAVVEDAKAFLGEEASDPKATESHHEESLGDFGPSSQVAAQRGQKKRRLPRTDEATGDPDADDSEAPAESVSQTQSGRRKRRNTSGTALQAPAEKRYNLRGSKRASRGAAAQGTAADQARGTESQPPESEGVKDAGNGEHGHSAAPSTGFGDEIKGTTHDNEEETIEENFTEIQDISSQKLVQFESNGMGRVECSRDAFATSADVGNEVDGSEAGLAEETMTPSDSEDGDDDDDSEKGNASIGNKLWKFFTT